MLKNDVDQEFMPGKELRSLFHSPAELPLSALALALEPELTELVC